MLTVTPPQAVASVPSHQPPACPAPGPSAQSLAQLRVWIVTKLVKFSQHHLEVANALASQQRQLIIINDYYQNLNFQTAHVLLKPECCSCSPRRWTAAAASPVGLSNPVPPKGTRRKWESLPREQLASHYLLCVPDPLGVLHPPFLGALTELTPLILGEVRLPQEPTLQGAEETRRPASVALRGSRTGVAAAEAWRGVCHVRRARGSTTGEQAGSLRGRQAVGRDHRAQPHANQGCRPQAPGNSLLSDA